VDDVAGFYLRLFDGLCVFHVKKINIVLSGWDVEFLYSVHYGRKKDI
jgi:hypothetical protein